MHQYAGDEGRPAEGQPPLALPFRAAMAGMELATRLGLLRGALGPDPASWARLGPAPRGAHGAEGLSRLLASIAAESDLTGFGRVSTRWDLGRLLKNAAHVEAEAEKARVAGTDRIEAPVFILGLPRSGTTFLHGLLAADPDNLVPRVWQTITPRPRPAGFRPEADRDARAVDRQLRIFAGFTPEFPAVHPIDADSPQECSEITAHVFQSLRFDTTFRIPSYMRWLETLGHDEAFAFHRRFLVCLQQGVAARRWVLKCPDHTFSLPAILRTYPDARFVIVHRDPIRVFASVAHLTEVLRRPFLKGIDPAEIGQQVVTRWIEGAGLLVDFDRSGAVPEARKINIAYETLTADPLAAIAGIYGHFGIPFTEAGREGIARALAARPRGRYRAMRAYAPARFGIRAEALTAGFGAYLEHFGIALAGAGKAAP